MADDKSTTTAGAKAPLDGSKPKAKAARAPKAANVAESLDRYEVVEVHRSQLKNAPYNPRTLDDKARDKLKRGIKKLGNLAPPTWNRRTGNMVGGHQRLRIFDLLHGTEDYRLMVAAVDLTDAEEREANLLLNNPEAMGDWDLEKLGGMFKDKAVKIDVDGTGFDVADLYRLFGDSPFVERTGELDALAEKLRDARSRYDNVGAKSAKRDGIDFYLVVVFRDDEDRTSFLEALELPDNRFQDGRQMRALLEARKRQDAEE